MVIKVAIYIFTILIYMRTNRTKKIFFNIIFQIKLYYSIIEYSIFQKANYKFFITFISIY